MTYGPKHTPGPWSCVRGEQDQYRILNDKQAVIAIVHSYRSQMFPVSQSMQETEQDDVGG